ncbi:MAG: hypothetical protein R3C09_03445 [Pirellulaceae bacterium]
MIYVFDREQKRLQRLEDIAGRFANFYLPPVVMAWSSCCRPASIAVPIRKPVGSLRTWDVVQGRQLAGVLLPELPTHRPTLAAFPSTSTAGGLHVLAAMGSGKMYQWETSQPPQLRHL